MIILNKLFCILIVPLYLYMVLPSTLMRLLYQITWDPIAEGRLGNDHIFSLHVLNICL